MSIIYPLSDETGAAQLNAQRAIGAELSKLVLLKETEIGHTVEELEDWGEFAAMVREDTAPIAFPAGGTRLGAVWKDKASSTSDESSYTAPMNVCHYGTGALRDGEAVKVAHLQFHHVLPFDTQFSPYQAFLASIDGLPAGTYNVTMPSSWVHSSMRGVTYQFTLTQDLPAGGQLAGFRQCSNAPTSSTLNIYAYASSTAGTAQETVTATQGNGGTSLGTFTTAGVPVPASGTPETPVTVTVDGNDYAYYGLNSIYRVAWGNNRWLHSPIRQYLNGYGHGWWSPATVFDRPPSFEARRGFLSGLPDGMVNHMLPIARKTALNYVTDGGTSESPEYDVTHDLVVLPSGIEHFLKATASYGGTAGEEGAPWTYWARVTGSSEPLAWSATGAASTYHPEFVQYDLGNPTNPRYAWMRSAGRGNGYNVANVNSTGYCGNGGAYYGYRVAPACAIG